MKQLRVVDLDEIAARWQIPVAVLQSFITDYGLNPARQDTINIHRHTVLLLPWLCA